MRSFILLILSLLFFNMTALAAGSFPMAKTNAGDFFYAQQTSLWAFFKIPRDVVLRELGDLIKHQGFEIAAFGDGRDAYVILKPMVFAADFGTQSAAVSGPSYSTEVEFTVLVHPLGQAQIPSGSFNDFLAGNASGNVKNKNVGQFRVAVICDNEVAVAAGRTNFGEHKFLSSFEYDYTTPNQNVKQTPPFKFDISAFTWQGAGQENRKMFHLLMDLKDLQSPQGQKPTFSPELVYTAFPPEPLVGSPARSVGQHRTYHSEFLQVVFDPEARATFNLSFGEAQGAVALTPVAPFGDGRAIPNSGSWPREMVSQLVSLLSSRKPAAFLVYQTPPAEFETQPFNLR